LALKVDKVVNNDQGRGYYFSAVAESKVKVHPLKVKK